MRYPCSIQMLMVQLFQYICNSADTVSRKWHTIVIVVPTVETALELVRASVLSFDPVVERTDIGRDVPCHYCSGSGDECTEYGGRNVHDSVSKCEDYTERIVRWTEKSIYAW